MAERHREQRHRQQLERRVPLASELEAAPHLRRLRQHQRSEAKLYALHKRLLDLRCGLGTRQLLIPALAAAGEALLQPLWSVAIRSARLSERRALRIERCVAA